MRRIVLCLILLSAWASSGVAADFHASPTGMSQGTGSRDAPWDLATAVAASEKVKPGDTLWLHEGTYVGGFTSQLAGTKEQPIVVRGEANKRVIIDARPRDEKDNALFAINGSDV